ncbi:hypothetical protein WICPIJ_008653 [Wickerhamomyces pijperi]|uniref:Origin recognition complex subunit 2 n=1 Tax=Wickerhamomyces pijperi TaxID=599730 RepID=A0A9P8PVU6_WICPI|nr:hypothetical protein WICPIJ_008653 [Wickerhamomyces pijperi]
MIIKRGRGRPKLSEEEKLRRLEERKRNQTQSQSHNHIHTLNLNGFKRGRGRPKLSEEEKQERKRQRLETLVKDEQHAKRVRIPRPSTAVTNISIDSEDDDDTDIVDTSDSEDDFGKRLKSTHGVKRGRGRPRLSEAEKERRAELRSLGMLHSKASFKLQKKEIRDNKLGDLIEIDQDDYEEDELGDDSDVEVTNFVFISNPKQQHELRDNTSVPKDKRIKIIHKNMHLINAEIFETPKQKRMGLLNLPTAMRTPSKRGIFKLNLPKTPNGRSGISRRLQFDTMIEFEEVENSFSLPQTPGKGTPLQSRSATPQSTLDTDPPSLSRSIFAPNSSRSRHGLPFNVQDFQPMPLPTAQDDERFFEGKYTDQSLFLDGPDGYFDQHKMKNPHSNNSMVQAPQLDYDEFNSLVLLSGFLHHPQKFELLQKYKEMYSQYYFELTENFNLLFYGVGSKRQFIEGFVQGHLLERIDDDEAPPVLVINGYNPATTLKEILTKIVQTLKISRAPKSTVELIEFLQKKFFTAKSNNPELILIIHNLDGPSLRDDKTQNYLSKLCSIKQIQLLASIDHLFAPLLWNSSRANNFNFVWHNVSTFMDYLTETSFEDPLILGQTQKSAGSKGAKFVLSSLTENAKALYRVLASNQLQNMEDDLATKRTQSDTTLKGALKHGLLFSQFFSLCAEEFISSNELNFRTMLMEFVEHKMCVLTKDQAGIEKVFIPFTLAEISKLLTDELL